MYFSMIRLRRNVSPNDILTLQGANAYHSHKLIWNLFSDSPDRNRDFLYRYESVRGWPTFYAVSDREPADSNGLWDIHAKHYSPKLSKGHRLAFSLRVNPIRSKRDEDNRQHRHDVVMDAKTQIGFKRMAHDKRPQIADLVQEAGVSWLKAREVDHGFALAVDGEKPSVRADGYVLHRLFKRNGQKPITISTLDFNGILTVSDPDVFLNETLYKGLGPAKGFGCGLMLVRRIR